MAKIRKNILFKSKRIAIIQWDSLCVFCLPFMFHAEEEMQNIHGGRSPTQLNSLSVQCTHLFGGN